MPCKQSETSSILVASTFYFKRLNMEIKVLSRKQAKEFESDKLWACISITCPDQEFPKISGVRRVDLLQLRFWDTDDDIEYAFDKSYAVRVWDFIKEIEGKADVLMLHCLMGNSRSPAIGAAIAKVLDDDDMFYFNKHTPNMLVYRRMIDVAYERDYL